MQSFDDVHRLRDEDRMNPGPVTRGAWRRRENPMIGRSPHPGSRRARRPVHAVGLLAAIAVALAGCGAEPSGDGTPPTTVTPMACGAAQTFTYAEVAGVDTNQLSLDVYTPPATDGVCTDRPLVVWVHGGGWAGGDKSEFMEDKIPLFNGAGFVFASVNYRLTDETLVPPSPQYPVHNDDTAASLAWLVEHAVQIGADPEQIAVLGHSAGGGITAAISTDERYLGRLGLPLDTIRCAGSMDGEGYDITAGATTSPPEWQPTYTTAFGTDPAVWADASPINHVAAGKGVPSFFIAARGIDWRVEQHLAFIAALDQAGVPVTVLDSRELEHADLTTLVGAPEDTIVTPALMEFLDGCFPR